MNPKKAKIPTNTITRDLSQFSQETGNVYETIVVLSNRANIIGNKIKKELKQKLEDFANTTDNLEEIFENREQIEISSYYEKLPKAVIVATEEYLEGELKVREPEEDEE